MISSRLEMLLYFYVFRRAVVCSSEHSKRINLLSPARIRTVFPWYKVLDFYHYNLCLFALYKSLSI
jgi:hypothetical protein